MKSNFISNLASHIKEKYDLKKEELTVVFPNKRAAFFLRSKFKELYDEDIWLPQMLSIQEAMTQWSGIRTVDTVDMLFELIAIDSELYQRGDSINVFGHMASQMAKDFDEIDQYGVDAGHLFSYINDLKRLGTWSLDGGITQKEQQYLLFFENLKRYYDRLRERLERQGKGYYGMITRQLAGLTNEELVTRVQGRMVIFAGFNALTPTERTIIDKLYKAGHAEVVWDFDRYYVDDAHNEAGLFARSYIQHDVPWKPTVFSDSLLTRAKEIHLVGVNGNTVQAKALQSLLQMEHKPDIAVILADEKLMIPALNAIPDDERYSHVNVSMGYPLKQTALDHLVTAFFTLHRKGRKVRNEGWYLWPILRILDSEIVQVIFDKQELESLNEYNIYINKNASYIYKEETFRQCCQSPDLQEFMELLLHDEIGQKPIDWLETLRALLVFIANKIQRAEQGGAMLFLLNQVSEAGKAVNRLKDVLERYPGYIANFDELEILYRLVSSDTSIKLNSSSTTGLQLMGLLEARNLDFNTFYMVGVNEGVLPAGKSYNSFIPYNIRKECGLPDDQEKQAVYAYHFYRQLQGADKVYFIYNTNGSDSGGEPSRFLMQIKHELAACNPLITIHEEMFAPKTEPEKPPRLLSAAKNDIVFSLAPTSLSTYLQCPFKFYLKYLMKIKDNSMEEETQNNVIGSVVHDTLQSLYETHCGTIITPELLKDAIRPSLDKTLDTVIRHHFSQGLPEVGYNYLNKLNIKKLFDNHFRYEEQDVKNNDISILAVEQQFDTTLQVDGADFRITGKADRIDCRNGIFRIVDYKTGNIDGSEVKVPKSIKTLHDIPEKALQLLIYKYLYLKNHPTTPPEHITAALFGLRNKQVCFELMIDYEPLNSDFIRTMDQLLMDALRSMMDCSVPYSQPVDTKVKPCHFCDFKAICANTEAGSKLADDR